MDMLMYCRTLVIVSSAKLKSRVAYFGDFLDKANISVNQMEISCAFQSVDLLGFDFNCEHYDNVCIGNEVKL